MEQRPDQVCHVLLCVVVITFYKSILCYRDHAGEVQDGLQDDFPALRRRIRTKTRTKESDLLTKEKVQVPECAGIAKTEIEVCNMTLHFDLKIILFIILGWLLRRPWTMRGVAGGSKAPRWLSN